jgi:hypothetical protein
MTSAFLTSQHGASFVSTLLGGGKKGGGGKDAVLPDGTLLTWTNVAGLYQRHVDLCAVAETKTREAQRGLEACLHFLAAHVNEVLASEARQSVFELSAPGTRTRPRVRALARSGSSSLTASSCCSAEGAVEE